MTRGERWRGWGRKSRRRCPSLQVQPDGVQVELFGEGLGGASNAAVSIGALDEGLPVRLDADGASVPQEGVVRRRHGNVADLGPDLARVERPVPLHLGDDLLQVRHGDGVFPPNLEDAELKVGLWEDIQRQARR